EFYEVTEAEPTVATLRAELLAWEHIYNTVRPHQSLGYKTPKELLQAKGYYQPRKEWCTGGTERAHQLDAQRPPML
ncbi:MAG: transposase, partial [Chloroflexi bacterium]|nr:transposase [Chloroflexota bacterium]MCL5074368.1 transposase [Chloroflexota bacterium]